ncbi:hypothetical protein M8J77_019569 [Diaphorina citri]|nr:hypothetical protein M8J77_019569 [Diaphorina citri]
MESCGTFATCIDGDRHQILLQPGSIKVLENIIMSTTHAQTAIVMSTTHAQTAIVMSTTLPDVPRSDPPPSYNH